MLFTSLSTCFSAIEAQIYLMNRVEPIGLERTHAAKMAMLSQDQLADRWQISPRTLEQWRWLVKGPWFLKIGARVQYRRSKQCFVLASAGFHRPPSFRYERWSFEYRALPRITPQLFGVWFHDLIVIPYVLMRKLIIHLYLERKCLH